MKLNRKPAQRSGRFLAPALLGGLLCSLTFGLPSLFGQESTGEATVDAGKLFKDLEQRRDVSNILSSVGTWDESVLAHRQLESTMLGLLSDRKLSKSERFTVFESIETLSMDKAVLSQDKVADGLLKLESNLSSPNLRLSCIEMLVHLDALDSTATVGKIGKLIQTIVADASLVKAKQKYPASLHATCLRALDTSKLSSSQLDSIEKLLDGVKDAGPQLRLALFDVVAQIANDAPSVFKKSKKSDFTRKLLELFSGHPALGQVGSRPQEVEELVFLLRPLGVLCADLDNDTFLSKATPDLVKALGHKHIDVVREAGVALLKITKANSPRHKLEFEDPLVQLMKVPGKDEDSKAKEALYFEFLGSTLEALLQDEKATSVAKRIEMIIGFLHRSVMTHVNMDMREKALYGLFAIEPQHFEEKYFNSAALKTLKKFILDCAGVMASPELSKKLPELVETMGHVLHEMTGQNLGTDDNEWNAWLRKEGKELF